MRTSLDQADFEAVMIVGHNLRGSGGAFGFQAITDIGGDLERAANGADLDASRRLVEELSLYLDDPARDLRLA